MKDLRINLDSIHFYYRFVLLDLCELYFDELKSTKARFEKWELSNEINADNGNSAYFAFIEKVEEIR